MYEFLHKFWQILSAVVALCMFSMAGTLGGQFIGKHMHVRKHCCSSFHSEGPLVKMSRASVFSDSEAMLCVLGQGHLYQDLYCALEEIGLIKWHRWDAFYLSWSSITLSTLSQTCLNNNNNNNDNNNINYHDYYYYYYYNSFLLFALCDVKVVM